MQGFSIIRTSIPDYLIWVYYGCNPLAYGIRALAINEMTAPGWGAAGPIILEEFGLFSDPVWIWYGVAFLWVSLLVMTLLGTLALMYTNPPSPRPSGELVLFVFERQVALVALV